MIKRLATVCVLLAVCDAASAQPVSGALQPPVTPACISSPFGERNVPGTRASHFHTGIDFPAPAGAYVHAAAAGRVVQIRRLGADGLEVDVLHDTPATGRFVTRYAHLGSVTPRLAGGQARLATGEPIGRVGRSGITYGTHLHFEVRIAGAPIDPEPFFAAPRCDAGATRD